MAKNSLKIVNKTDFSKINSDGYISVVDQLIVDQDGLDEFGGDEEDAGFTRRRTRRLLRYVTKTAADVATNATMTQLSHAGAEEEATKLNLKIRANIDERRKATDGFNRVTVALPEDAVDVGQSDYIDQYIEKFMQEWTGSSFTLPSSTDERRARARKFMFGVMLLTRCR